jgi:hypothetical protein
MQNMLTLYTRVNQVLCSIILNQIHDDDDDDPIVDWNM